MNDIVIIAAVYCAVFGIIPDYTTTTYYDNRTQWLVYTLMKLGSNCGEYPFRWGPNKSPYSQTLKNLLKSGNSYRREEIIKVSFSMAGQRAIDIVKTLYKTEHSCSDDVWQDAISTMLMLCHTTAFGKETLLNRFTDMRPDLIKEDKDLPEKIYDLLEKHKLAASSNA